MGPEPGCWGAWATGVGQQGSLRRTHSCLPVNFLPRCFLVPLLLKIDQAAEFLTPLLRKIPPSHLPPAEFRKSHRLFHGSGPPTHTLLPPRLFLLPERSLLLGVHGSRRASRAAAALSRALCGAWEMPANVSRGQNRHMWPAATFQGSFAHGGPITGFSSDLMVPFAGCVTFGQSLNLYEHFSPSVVKWDG